MAFPNNKETIKKDWTNITETKYTHPDEHNLVGEVVEALQDKVGIDGDANTDSFDYKLSTVTGVDKVAPKTATDNAISAVQQNLTDHENDTANPHSVNKTQVGLSNVTNDKQVALTGDQTIAGVKNFSSSPKIPNASVSDDAVNKEDLDNAVQGVNRNTVGLFTKGDFISEFTTNLQFNRIQEFEETNLTGTFPNSSSISVDTLDGVQFVVSDGDGSNLEFGEYSLSGTVYSTVFSKQNIDPSSIASNTTCVKLLDSTTSFVAGLDGGDLHIYIIDKSGSTWSVTDSVEVVGALPSPGAGDSCDDIFIDSGDLYVSTLELSTKKVRVHKFNYTPTTIGVDISWSVPSFVPEDNFIYNAKFNSNSEITTLSRNGSPDFDKYLERFSFSSGSISTVGNKFNSGDTLDRIYYYSPNRVLASGTQTRTFFFNGTDFVLESINSYDANFFGDAVVYNNFLYIDDKQLELIGTGVENSIEDLDASGHLGYIASVTTSNISSTCRDLIVTETTNNNGTYNIVSCTNNKVILDNATLVNTAETEEGMIGVDFSDREGFKWEVKGSNFYLGS